MEVHPVMWRLPNRSGKLVAKGINGTGTAAPCEIRMAGVLVVFRATANREQLVADGQDLSYVQAELLDAGHTLVQLLDRHVKAAIEGEGRLTGFVNSDLRRTAPFTSCEETRISGGPWPSCRPRAHRAPFVCVSMWREWESPSLLNFLLPHGSRGMCPAFRVTDRNRTGWAGRTGGTRRGRGVLKQHVDRSLEKKM